VTLPRTATALGRSLSPPSFTIVALFIRNSVSMWPQGVAGDPTMSDGNHATHRGVIVYAR
jgi:hypothetical protein